MSESEFYDEITFIKHKVLAKFPALGVYMAKVKYLTANCQTACTDGRNVYVDLVFWDKCNEDEKIFVLAHEIFHIALNHIKRCKTKDREVWNIATDVIINQILLSQNLSLVKNAICIKDSANKSSDEVYEELLELQQKYPAAFNQLFGINTNQPSNNKHIGHDNHDYWSEALPEGIDIDEYDDFIQENQDDNQIEKNFVEKNNELKNKIANEKEKTISNDLEEIKTKKANELPRRLGRGDAYYKNPIDFRKLLRRGLDKEETRWSDRRADEDNDWMSRAEDIEEDDDVETEVMIDVSVSVDKAKIQGFLHQLKRIIKETKLRVGRFDKYIYPFVEIKKESDIDNLEIRGKGWTTEDFDAAVRCFSKDPSINKIIFSDGNATSTIPDDETRNINVLWLIFGTHMSFKPVCGKVIKIDEELLVPTKETKKRAR
jgi:predicted metal-dependent peptidase